ncbi:MAG TPA: tail fiber domain-containing protein [Candidatus Binatia bacterium]|nr:tail fiber domain-containing protein [Candidatus Binatia bacterium]
MAAAGTLLPAAGQAAPPGNVKLGKQALKGNTGSDNTAVGVQAMSPNAACTGAGAPNACCTGAGKGTCGNSGSSNTAVGRSALLGNLSGVSNTAVGLSALSSNTTGAFNVAVGDHALLSSPGASDNTAVGSSALQSNTLGDKNVAVGRAALFANTEGVENTAFGRVALFANTKGNQNVAVGNDALSTNTIGGGNTAVGASALRSNTLGHDNVAIGSAAGADTTGNSNIDIGNGGLAGESNTIRIGDIQTATFVAGISGATSAGGVAVFVNGDGRLGTTTSSARFKEDVRAIGDESRGLLKLRPVRFRYKPEIDASGLEQYGLVAEEVAKVYPDLVVYDDEGRPQTVRYHFVNAMLLNEVQRQARRIDVQRREIDALTARLLQVERALHREDGARPLEARAAASPG